MFSGMLQNAYKKYITGTCTICRSHIGHIVYSMPFSNYLREGIDEGFDSFGLNRFGGLPGGGPGTTCEARGRFFGDLLIGILRGSCFLGIRCLGAGLGRFAFGWPDCTFRFFDLGMTISFSSSTSSSSSSESSSSLNASRCGMTCFGPGFLCDFMCVFNAPAFPHRLLHWGHWNAFLDMESLFWTQNIKFNCKMNLSVEKLAYENETCFHPRKTYSCEGKKIE